MNDKRIKDRYDLKYLLELPYKWLGGFQTIYQCECGKIYPMGNNANKLFFVRDNCYRCGRHKSDFTRYIACEAKVITELKRVRRWFGRSGWQTQWKRVWVTPEGEEIESG